MSTRTRRPVDAARTVPMGISRGVAALLVEEHRVRPFHGHLLQLGRQEVRFPAETLRRLLRRRGLPEDMDGRSGAISDRAFFRALGFADIDALDTSAYEGADIIHDLNRADTPLHLESRFDAVFDGGTLEHVFHVPNALRHICRMLGPGGRVVHACPASNAVEHGYYSLSPAFFAEFYEANRFELLTLALVRFGTFLRPTRIVAFDATPPLRRELVDGALTSHVYYTFVVARKTGVSTCDAMPQQSWFRERWARAAEIRADGGVLSALHRRAREVPILSTLLAHGIPGRRWMRQVRCRMYLERRASRY